MALQPLLHLAFLTLSFPLGQPEKLSFTAQLIHKDSLNTTNTLLSSTVKAFQSPLLYYNGDYLIRIAIGTTPILLNFALGSDITWVPCLAGACSQRCNGRLFDPAQSPSFKTLTCNSDRCQVTAGASCRSPDCVFACTSPNCPAGVLSTDTFTLTTSPSDRPIVLPNTAFICGNGVTRDYPGVGIIGLGHGSLSLLSRIYHLIDGAFSYCLVPYSSNLPSKMGFGLKGVVSGSGVVSTPFQPMSSRYIIQLNGVRVGGKRFGDHSTALYVDPGVMFTRLPDAMFTELEKRVRGAVRMEPVQSGNSRGLRLCYRYSGDFDPPRIVLEFVGGRVELGGWNSFARVEEGTICLAFESASGGKPVYGSWQQMNFLVGFDLKNGVISFKGTDCTQYE